MNGHCKFKMKWFAGNSTTNAEGKFEYQEPKLLRIVPIPEDNDNNTLSIHLENRKRDERQDEGAFNILSLHHTHL